VRRVQRRTERRDSVAGHVPGLTVWVARPSSGARKDDRALLAPTELERMYRLVHAADQDRFSVAWALTRRTLGGLLGIDPRRLRFDRSCALCGDDQHGKPRLLDGALEFSIAHAADRVLLAVADRIPVGVDVEPADALVAEAAALVRHASEHDVEGAELVRLWVRKEAVLKATGHGLARPMTDFGVRVAPDGMFLTDLALGENYVAALAARSDRELDLTVVSEVTGSR